MVFNSYSFLLFFPIVACIYFVVPNRLKKIWLLASSYYFYMSWNAKYALLILFSTIVTYVGGILIQHFQQQQGKQWIRRTKLLVAMGVLVNMSMLFYFKYVNFFFRQINHILTLFGSTSEPRHFDVILPVGISFFTFQTIGYLIDVYRGETEAEHNFITYALFVSFFPQLVAGPIERSKNLLAQVEEPHSFDYERAVDGFLIALWGFFLKIVIADRIAIFVDTVYGDIDQYQGFYLVVAMLLFVFQIYCDFYGYSVIAKGVARILGINLMENFEAPFLAESVSEFWQRWHISLTSWFRDYMFYPMLRSKIMQKIRKRLKKRGHKYWSNMLPTVICTAIVWMASGLWHGAGWNYVIWGGLSGFVIILEETIGARFAKWNSEKQLIRETTAGHIGKKVLVVVFYAMTKVFFRASNTAMAIHIFRNMFSTWNPWILFDGSLYECGLDSKNFVLLLLSIVLLMVADTYKKRGVEVRKVMMQQGPIFRWAFLSLSIFAVMLFGIWGASYDATSFIYFQF